MRHILNFPASFAKITNNTIKASRLQHKIYGFIYTMRAFYIVIVV